MIDKVSRGERETRIWTALEDLGEVVGKRFERDASCRERFALEMVE